MRNLTTLFVIIFIAVIMPCELWAQDPPIENPFLAPQIRKPEAPSVRPSAFRVTLRKPGHLTVQDWRDWVDTVWGQGLPTSDKLAIFDEYWNIADETFGGFPNLSVAWDSVRDRYRPEIVAGVSRGRFYAIMSQLWMGLQEIHTWARDMGIDSSFYIGIDEAPATEGYWMVKGFPLWRFGNWGISTVGAGIAPMPDSSLFVYRTQAGNPLDLEPGDIILGYDGVPWRQLLSEMDSAQIPVASYFSLWGTSREGFDYTRLVSAANSWYLFDTMDVVRYLTGDTVHLSVDPLASAPAGWDSLFLSDQLPVPGIPMPNPMKGTWCTWGIIDGTSIGYIYAYDWLNIDTVFTQAVADLMHTTTGLILDFRFNEGGYPAKADGGFSQLYNEDNVTDKYTIGTRSDPLDHLGFTLHAASSLAGGAFVAAPDIYDHPIAVLTGPSCLSAGDYNVFRMRFHPMVRFFGKTSNTGYVDGNYSSGVLVDPGWLHRLSQGSVYSLYNDEGYLIHKGFNVDEEIWQSREDAANGVDAVVKRAMEWIDSLSYAHDVKTSLDSLIKMSDSLAVTAHVENPGGHTLVVSGIVSNAEGGQIDSLILFDDGLHHDSLSGDGIAGAFVRSPGIYGNYDISVRTDDQTAGSYRRLNKVTSFYVHPNAIVETNPSGPVFVVDGLNHTGQEAYSWEVGTQHPVAVNSPQKLGVIRYRFSSWSDGGEISHTVTAQDSPKTYTASFILQLKLTTSVSPDSTAGSIHAVPDSVERWYDLGTSVELTALPGTGYTFTAWSGDLNGTTNPQTIVMSAGRTVTANFSRITNMIIALSGGNGTISPQDTVPVLYGESQRIVFTPDPGSYVDSVIVDNEPVDSTEGYTFTNVIEPHTIRVVFASFMTVEWTVDGGWNLISLPVEMSEYRKDSLFTSAISEAFEYDTMYKSSDSLVRGKGYWLKFTAAGMVNMTGNWIIEDTVEVKEGWNLIGSISSPVPVNSITSDDTAMKPSNFFGYEGSYFTTDTIYPGRGYWVKVNHSGNLMLSSDLALATTSASNRIKIVATSEQPPPPPDGVISNLSSQIPDRYTLEQNHPNPFNPTTTIRYAIPYAGYVTLKIYDVLGREVVTLVDENQEAGYKSVEWDANKSPSGVYFYRIFATTQDGTVSFTEVKKMILLR